MTRCESDILLATSIGETICQIRKGKKIKQQELAAMTNISRITLSRIEHGKRLGFLSLWSLNKIAAALGLRMSDIVRRAEENIAGGKNVP